MFDTRAADPALRVCTRVHAPACARMIHALHIRRARIYIAELLCVQKVPYGKMYNMAE